MIEVWFDGVCEPTNPNGYGAYGLFVTRNGQELLRKGVFVGQGKGISNNVAEYSGFLYVLKFLEENKFCDEKIIIKGDSKLVIEQMFGSWRIREGLYIELAHKTKEELKKFSNVCGCWIPREENEICDKLAKDILRNMGIKFRIQPD